MLAVGSLVILLELLLHMRGNAPRDRFLVGVDSILGELHHFIEMEQRFRQRCLVYLTLDMVRHRSTCSRIHNVLEDLPESFRYIDSETTKVISLKRRAPTAGYPA